MRRRDLLRAAGAAGAMALPTVGVGAASDAADTTVQSEAYEPLATLELADTREAVVSDDGETAYVVGGEHLWSVDVSDPTDPAVLAHERDLLADHEKGPLTGLQDVKVDGDSLVVAGPPSPSRTGDPLKGIVLFDVSDPADPEQQAFQQTEGHANHNVFLDGDHVYATGTDFQDEALHVYDVSGGAFEEVATWTLVDHDDAWSEVHIALRNLHDVYVQDGMAYLAKWDAGTVILDVSDPAKPEFVSRFGDYTREELAEVPRGDLGSFFVQPDGNAHYVTVDEDGTLLGEGGESWDQQRGDDAGGPSPITLWDVSDPANPTELATIDAPESGDNRTQGGVWTTSHNFDIENGRLYSSWYSGGVRIHDLSDPSAPELLAWWRSPQEAAFWTAQSALSDQSVLTDFFVATSYAEVPNADTSALYTFPDRAGVQADPPGWGTGTEMQRPLAAARDDPGTTTTQTPTPTPTATPTPTPDDSTPTPTPTDTPADPTATPTDGPTANDDVTATPTDADDGGGESNGGGLPGFGVPAAVAALGLGAWRTLRSDDE